MFEILQTEIWSRKTSKRVFWGLIFVAVIAIFSWKAWRAYQYYRVTDGERTAARAALQEIDKVRTLKIASYEEFGPKFSNEQKAIAVANAAAVTERDQIIAMQLEDCDIDVRMNRLNSMLQDVRATTPQQRESMARLQMKKTKLSALTSGKCEALHKVLY
jgi:predicted negative regulator of RcsB-dependent stress response